MENEAVNHAANNDPTIDALSRDDALAIVSASLDGEATPEELDALAQHLVDHPDTRAAADAMVAQDALLRSGHQTIDAAPRRIASVARRPARRRPRRRALIGALAAVALVAVAGVLLFGVLRETPEGAARTADATPSASVDVAPSAEPASSARPARDAEPASAAALDDRLAQASTLLDGLAQARPRPAIPSRARANPFRDRRDDAANPFTRSAARDQPHPFARPRSTASSRTRT